MTAPIPLSSLTTAVISPASGALSVEVAWTLTIARTAHALPGEAARVLVQDDVVLTIGAYSPDDWWISEVAWDTSDGRLVLSNDDVLALIIAYEVQRDTAFCQRVEDELREWVADARAEAAEQRAELARERAEV